MTVLHSMPGEAAQKFILALRAYVERGLEVRFHTMSEQAIAFTLHVKPNVLVGTAAVWTSGEFAGQVISAQGQAVPVLNELMDAGLPPKPLAA